jgi:hypothetical protein
MSLSSPLLPELTPDEQALLEKGKTELQNAQLTDEQKEWILHMLKGGVKISTSQVLRIWKIVDQRKKALGVDLQSECLWVEVCLL